MKRGAIVAILILAFCGIADSAYLTQQEVAGVPLICNIENLSGCNTVVASPYSHLLGIPLAYYGLGFYTLMFICAAFELVLIRVWLRRVLQGLAVFGMLVSLYSVYVQTFLVRALCVYCLISVVLTILVLIFASLIEPLPNPLSRRLLTAAPQQS